MKNRSIIGISNCYGCGVCVIACPRNLITLALNKKGFYEPQIKEIENCINCGLCLKVCSYQDDTTQLNEDIKAAYAIWSNDEEVRQKCSSGGIAYELSRQFIAKKYKVCGVRYNINNNRAEHYIASSIPELEESVGSKYLQSYTLDGFSGVDENGKYVIFGTPCQIDSYRRYLKRFKIQGNYILVDFFCHGVPSKNLWNKYLLSVPSKDDITDVFWRHKRFGWHNSWAIGTKVVKGKEQIIDYFSLFTKGDTFYKNVFK